MLDEIDKIALVFFAVWIAITIFQVV